MTGSVPCRATWAAPGSWSSPLLGLGLSRTPTSSCRDPEFQHSGHATGSPAHHVQRPQNLAPGFSGHGVPSSEGSDESSPCRRVQPSRSSRKRGHRRCSHVPKSPAGRVRVGLSCGVLMPVPVHSVLPVPCPVPTPPAHHALPSLQVSCLPTQMTQRQRAHGDKAQPSGDQIDLRSDYSTRCVVKQRISA